MMRLQSHHGPQPTIYLWPVTQFHCISTIDKNLEDALLSKGSSIHFILYRTQHRRNDKVTQTELELTTDSEAEIELTTDSEAELELTTDSEAEQEFELITDSEAEQEFELTTDSEAELEFELSTNSEA
jgi:hypothetical protein